MAQSSGSFTVRPSSAQRALNHDEHPGGATMLGDAIVASRLLKEAFRRTIGVTSFAGMTIATVVLARELQRIAGPAFRRARPRRPSFAGTMTATAVLREPLRGIAGDQARNTRFAGTLIAFSLLVPAVRRIAASVAASAHMVRAGLHGVRAALLP